MIILDLDGTISNDAWRLDRIREDVPSSFEKYHAYHSLSAFDEVMNEDLFRGTKHDVAIFTGRPILYQPVTEEWLKRNGIMYKVLMMRSLSDTRPAAELKQEFFVNLVKAHKEAFPKNRLKVVSAYDDSMDVVRMFRKKCGIKAKLIGVKKGWFR
jgi:hypothetical protein